MELALQLGAQCIAHLFITGLAQQSEHILFVGFYAGLVEGINLQQITGQAADIFEEVNQIAGALSDQESAFREINSGVEEINEVVQSNSATSEESAAASEEMASQANVLKELVGKFVIKE